MNRRRFSVLAASSFIAGCVGTDQRETSKDRAETNDTTDQDAGKEPTVNPTTEPPNTGSGEDYAFGEWHTAEIQDWGVTVEEVTTATSFVINGLYSTPTDPIAMPDDEQLVFAKLRLKNLQNSSNDTLNPSYFSFIVGEELHESRGGFNHPERGEVGDTLLEADNEIEMLKGTTHFIESGKTIERQIITVTPRISAEKIGIGADLDVDSDLEARWTPE